MRVSAGPAARRLALIALVLCPLAIHAGLASRAGAYFGTTALDVGLIAASALPHASIYCFLLAAFGLTLLPGRVPLVTAMARGMHGQISDELTLYTRGVTWAWSLFFAGQLLTSLALFLLAPLAVWSLFVNIVSLPLNLLMFAAEQAYRIARVRDAPRHSLADILRMIAYVSQGGAARTEKAAVVPPPAGSR